MSFETDKQTLDDLNLLGKYKNNSVTVCMSGRSPGEVNEKWRICSCIR